MNVSLTPELERFARSLVESGRYRSASEVVRDSLRLLEDRESKTAELRRLIHEGLESGDPVTVTRESLREAIGQRMAELRGEVERGERPAPGGPDAVEI
ncbi:type II toxin-antitoxin system ParD family antitoxin [Rubrivirga sp.]|uniref:type II toxin-antitoxin system ParD family antitoxin n=1 Tax=Rubrivirga sp. TaxID=1885344 RepID=UPI003B51C069